MLATSYPVPPGTATPTLGRRVRAFVAAWREMIENRRTLGRLSDRELGDLGYVRGDLDSLTSRI